MRIVGFDAGGRRGIAERTSLGLRDLGYSDVQSLLTSEAGRRTRRLRLLDDIRITAPIRPGKLVCCGVNYRSHLAENPAASEPDEPFFFSKLSSAVIGPGDAIVIPRINTTTDYEVELAMVIGRRCKSLTPDNAMDAVFGWTVVNDVSARDIQFKDNQITLGKGVDTFAPIGPVIVTADEFGDPGTMSLWTRVNGELRQHSDASDWFFSPQEILVALTALITLEPGDVVTTGTPSGVAAFSPGTPWLRPGDTVTVAVDGIGELTNPVAAGY